MKDHHMLAIIIVGVIAYLALHKLNIVQEYHTAATTSIGPFNFCGPNDCIYGAGTSQSTQCKKQVASGQFIGIDTATIPGVTGLEQPAVSAKLAHS